MMNSTPKQATFKSPMNSNNSNHSMNTNDHKPTILVTTLFEKEVVECLRFALQYLRNAHQAVVTEVIPPILYSSQDGGVSNNTSTQGSSNNQTNSHSTNNGSGTSSNNHTNNSSGSSNSGSTVGHSHIDDGIALRWVPLHTESTELSSGVASASLDLNAIKNGHARSVSFSNTSMRQAITSPRSTSLDDAEKMGPSHHGIDKTRDGTDTRSAMTPDPSQTTPNTAGGGMVPGMLSCANCSLLSLRVDHTMETVNRLENQVAFLKKNLEMEVNLRERTQVAKEVLETELEELTAQLFDQANKMVEAEAKRRDELEITNRGLAVTLKSREEEFEQLKNALARLESVKRKSITGNHPSSALEPVVLDGHELKQFIEFLKRVTAMPESALLSTETLAEPLMKKCFTEDVEPCLAPLHAGVLNGLVKKRVLDVLIHGQYEFQTLSTTPTDGLKCFLCGTLRECGFGFHAKGLSLPGIRPLFPNSTVYPIDVFCRLRLLAIGHFYSFIYKLKLDKLGQKSILELFKSWLLHKRQMAEARIGSVDLFKEDVELSGPHSTPVVIRN
ncbi:Guanine nucleotide exchange factor (GEF) which may activate RAB8A and RAB8B [Coelomomyces lativittatus]|nr:Guanine nucleotide exchange factor (GEF) which may activate RAB8A and RAB8B [Coelomomyces lativittatus]